ncbi:MAG: DoxX family protein [Myxococcota bacterium]
MQPEAKARLIRTIPVHIVRTLLGALFVFAGVAYFVGLGEGGEEGEGQIELIAAFASSGYLMALIKVTELIGGLLLVVNRFVPLGLLLLAPITLNIALFHFVLTPGHDIGISIFVVAANVFLAWAYRSAWRGVLSARTPIGNASAE